MKKHLQIHGFLRQVLSLALAAALTLGLAPAFTPGSLPGLLPPIAALADGAPEAESELPRTIFANIGPGGFNSANTSRGLLDPNKTMFINGTRGDAGILTADGAVALTTTTGSNAAGAGSAFLSRRIYSETGFSARFEMRLGPRGSDASDGFAFVVAKNTNKIGGTANSIGYAGIPDSFAFIYDTFYNSVKGQANNSAYVPQVQKAQNGDYILATAENLNAPGSYGSVLAFPGEGLGGAANYSVFGWVDYDSKNRTMALYLSLAPEEGKELTKPKNPISEFTGIDIEAVLGNQYFIGFTAANGRQQHILKQFYVFNENAPKVDFNGNGVGMNMSDGEGGGEDTGIIEDYTPPSAPVVTQSSSGMTDALMVFTVGGSDDENGVRKYQYQTGSETVWHDYTDAGGNELVLDSSRLITTAIIPGGSAEVRARALDHGGNISSETSATLKYNIAPGPTMTAPADKAAGVFPANTPELIISFKSKINIATVGTVTVKDTNNNTAAFATGPIIADDARWDASQSKLTLPFALGDTGLGYGKSYIVTVSGFVNTSNISMGDNDEPATVTYTFSTIGREATPNAAIDFTNERLTGLTSNVVYKINGAEYTASGGVVPIQASWLGTAVRIVKPGTAATVDSAAQELEIPARRNAPADLGSGLNRSRITGTTADMEYAASAGAASWTSCTASATEVDEGTYYVRYKVSASEFKSETTTVEVQATTYTLNAAAPVFTAISDGDTQPEGKNLTITSSGNSDATISGVTSSSADFTVITGDGTVSAGGANTSYKVQPVNLKVGTHTATITVKYNGDKTATVQVSITVREKKPAIAIDYVNEQLTGLTPGDTYTVNGNSLTASTGKLNIENAWLGTTLTIVKTNANTALNSEAQSLYVAPRSDPPQGVTATNETYAGEKDGKLTDVTAAMEYRRNGAAVWTPGTGDTITNLAPGEYQVRYTAGAGASFHSRAVQLTVEASRKYKLTATVSADPGGELGKVNTSYLLVTLTHDNSANNAVPIAGLAEASSSTTPGAWVSGAAAVGVVTDNGDADDKTWRVNINPTENNAQATLTLTEWTAQNGNTYTVTNIEPASVTVYKSIPELTPAAQVNYADETLTNLTGTDHYTINGADRQAAGGIIPISDFIEIASGASDASKTTLRIIKTGGTATADSAAQTIEIPKRRPAPPITPVPPQAANGKASITGVDTTMQYQSGDAGWTDVTSTSITGLGSGVYHVRYTATSAAFHSRMAEAVFHNYGAIDFGDVYEGYSLNGTPGIPAKTVTNTGGGIVDSAELTGAKAASFTLNPNTGSSATRQVRPAANLPADDYEAVAQFKDASSVALDKFDLYFGVHKKANILSVTPHTNDTTKLTDSITVVFEHPIDLAYGDISVAGGAVKSGAGFTDSGSGPRTEYTLAVTPQMSAADGAAIRVQVNLDDANLRDAYAYQLSQPDGRAMASSDGAKVSIPRAIESAEAFTPVSGYSTGYVQFTLNREKYPIDTDAIEEVIKGQSPGYVYSGNVLLKVGDTTVTPTYIFRVDNDMGYTFRVLIEPTVSGADGTVKLSVPGFGITEPFTVKGGVTKADATFTGNAYVLSAHGGNYPTDVDDAHQILHPIDAAPDAQTPVYAAPALELRVNREHGDGWTISEFYLGGEPYAGYTISGGGELDQIFDGVTNSQSYPKLTNYLKITLPEGWTRDDGTYAIRAVLTKADEHILLLAKVTVTGITPTYALTVTGGSGGGRYPAGAAVPIAGETPAPIKAFLGWAQAAQSGAAGYIAKLPSGLSGTVIMPAGDAALTASYADRGAAPSASVSYASETLALSDGDYSFNAGSPVTVTGGAYPIDEAWFGATLTVRSVKYVEFGGGGARVRVDSVPSYVDIPARTAQIPDAVGVPETFYGFSDGRLTYVNSAMEYDDGHYIWEGITGAAVENLAPGTYYVRYKATASAFASASQIVEIEPGEPPVWAIELDKSATFSFPEKAYGYGPVTPLTVKITNAGNQPTGALTVNLSGSDFTLAAPDPTTSISLPGIPRYGAATFTVAPVDGLAVDSGPHTAKVTVSSDTTLALAATYDTTFEQKSFDVNFEVKAATITGFIVTPASVLAGKATETMDTGYENATNVAGTLNSAITVKGVYAGGTVVIPVSLWAESTTKPYSTSEPGEYPFEATLDASAITPNPNNYSISGSLSKPAVIVRVNDIIHGVTLDASSHAFPEAQYGYTPASKTINITNIGVEATEDLVVAVSGDTEAFSVPGTVGSIAVGGSGELTVNTAANLFPGTYGVTITVEHNSSTNIDLVSKTYDLSFTVTPAEITGFESIDDIPAGVSGYGAVESTEIQAELPDTVTAYATYGQTLEGLSVTWADTDGYDPGVPGGYTFTGTIAPPTYYLNPHGYTAAVKVVAAEPVHAKAPGIVLQPEAEPVYFVGADYALEIAAEPRDGGTLTHQWYTAAEPSAYDGDTGTATGGNAKSLSVPSSATGTTYYWCVVTNTNDDATGEKTAERKSRLAAVTLRYAVLTVVNGTISGGADTGSFSAGATVPIKANDAPAGQIFSAWTQPAGKPVTPLPSTATGSITMPAGDATLEATYRPMPYLPPPDSSTANNKPDAETPSSTNTVTADNGKVQLDYKASGGGVTISLPENKVGEIIKNVTGGEASFDVSKVDGAYSVTFTPKSGLSEIAEDGLKIKVIFPSGVVTLDSGAAKSLISQAHGTEITFEVKEMKTAELTAAQSRALPGTPEAFDVSVYSGGEAIHSYAGELIITVAYAGKLPVSVWYVSDAGATEKLPSTYSTQNKTVTFKPPHLSLYA
ncbi:MAG: hypothetical protein LBK23_09870, partial [Oscillospiraceae bacterium]|nr:hypothetical protein [Oscillospiraceae bacterium]